MKAFGHTAPRPLDAPDAIVALEVPPPEPGPLDLLVAPRAVSINPVDYKVRANFAPEGPHRILGWDAAGDVLAVGSAVEGFVPGDKVYYAGDLTRPGAQAEQQTVDHRIVAKMPTSLGYAEAAALPLTAITAWEMLFDRLRIAEGGGAGESLLIMGAGGGVGSIAIQLARALTGLTVIGTASRPETEAWVREMGAQHVVSHAGPFAEAVREIVPDGVDYVISTNGTDQHLDQIVEAMKPQARFGLIDDPAQFDIAKLKLKSISLHWEFMFTRSMFATGDIAEQGRLLARVARLVDEGQLRSTVGRHLGTLSVESLREAHALLETGRAKGKLVLDVA
ncbi:MAG: zinc-binding alcohol dehydrogenase family protein [Pseudomonadota bacterium]